MKFSVDEQMVLMVQEATSRWVIKTPKGVVLKSDITVSSPLQAEDYVKRYISSFMNWSYKLVLLEKSKK